MENSRKLQNLRNLIFCEWLGMKSEDHAVNGYNSVFWAKAS